MTLQEAFDRMVTHLRQQGRPASVEGTCLYRGTYTDEQGRTIKTACAVGCLIPDDEYDPKFEDRTVSGIFSKVPSMYGLSREFLSTAQRIHDRWRNDVPFDEEPAKGFKYLAEDYNLDSSALTRPLTPPE